MFGKIARFGAALVLLASVGVAASANGSSRDTCPLTGRERRQCCASKASPMPPCCQKRCDTPGRILR